MLICKIIPHQRKAISKQLLFRFYELHKLDDCRVKRQTIQNVYTYYSVYGRQIIEKVTIIDAHQSANCLPEQRHCGGSTIDILHVGITAARRAGFSGETRTPSNGLMTSSRISDVWKFNLASRGAR